MNINNIDVFKPRFEHHYMLGMRLDYISADTFVEEFIQSAQMGNSVYCCVPDVYQCMICHDNDAHRGIVNGADYVMSDSVIMQTARALRHGVSAVKTLLGSDMMLALCKEAEANHIPIALLGGRDESVLTQLKTALIRDFPALNIAFGYSPPFRELTSDEETSMLGELANSGAKLVFIGIGCPKQEQWMARYKGTINASMIGVGAAFDTISGLVNASPAFVHRFGLEWLFRLIREPRRLYRRYLISAPRFVWLNFLEYFRAKTNGGKS